MLFALTILLSFFDSSWQRLLFTPKWWLSWMKEKGYWGDVLLLYDLVATHGPLSHPRCNDNLCFHVHLNDSSHQCCLQTFLPKAAWLSLQQQRTRASRPCQYLSLETAGKRSCAKPRLITEKRTSILFHIPSDQDICSCLFVFLLNFEKENMWVIERLSHIVWRKQSSVPQIWKKEKEGDFIKHKANCL